MMKHWLLSMTLVVGSVAAHSVHQLDIAHFNESVVLRKPGTYVLCSNSTYRPTNDSTSAIRIDGDNIHLDLGGFTLEQGNGMFRTIGIEVAPGHENVSIVNGVVKGFTEFGIVVQGDNRFLELGEKGSKLTVKGCGFGSSLAFVDDQTGLPLLQGGIRLGDSHALEAHGYYDYKGRLDTVQVTGVFASENSPMGLLLGVGSNICFDECSFSGNVNGRPNGMADPFGLNQGGRSEKEVMVFGAVYVATEERGDTPSQSIVFTECHFDRNALQAAGPPCCAGIFAFSAWTNMKFIRCSANGNAAPFEQEPGFTDLDGAAGFFLIGGTSTYYEECTAHDNFSTEFLRGFTHRGVDPTGTGGHFGTTFVRCAASRNRVDGMSATPVTSVFDIRNGSATQLIGCSAHDNVCFSSVPDAIGTARALLLINSSGMLVRECQFTGTLANQSTAIRGIFITIEGIESRSNDVVIDSCYIAGNRNENTAIGQGILGLSVDALVLTGCTIVDQNIGILAFALNDAVIEHNLLSDIDVVGIQAFGECCSIRDNLFTTIPNGLAVETNNTNLVAQNKAFNTLGYAAGYPFPFPVVTGSLSTGFPGQQNACENILVTKSAIPPVSQQRADVLAVEKKLRAEPSR